MLLLLLIVILIVSLCCTSGSLLANLHSVNCHCMLVNGTFALCLGIPNPSLVYGFGDTPYGSESCPKLPLFKQTSLDHNWFKFTSPASTYETLNIMSPDNSTYLNAAHPVSSIAGKVHMSHATGTASSICQPWHNHFAFLCCCSGLCFNALLCALVRSMQSLMAFHFVAGAEFAAAVTKQQAVFTWGMQFKIVDITQYIFLTL